MIVSLEAYGTNAYNRYTMCNFTILVNSSYNWSYNSILKPKNLSGY